MKIAQSPKPKAQSPVPLVLLICFCFLFAARGFAKEELIPVIKFKEVDIKIVLQAIAQKALIDGKELGEKTRVNIITSPQVKGLVTVDLENMSWLTALEGILKAYGYGYEWIAKDLILVATLDELAEKREKEALASQQEPLETVNYKLKFLDATDVAKLLGPQLSPRGRITVLKVTVQKGWKAKGGLGIGEEAGSFEQAEREEGARSRSKTLVITDTKSNMRNILKAIFTIDIMPKQVLIEAKIMEVNRDLLRDIGFDYATGTGATGTAGSFSYEEGNEANTKNFGGHILGSSAPSVFGAKSAGISGSDYNDGLQFVFRKIAGTKFESLIHALEEDVSTNTLSAPRILTLDGQEAYIMVGIKKPIIKSTIESSETSVGISKELDYYQNLGVELNVVPQICDGKYINMLIYPSVTSSSENTAAVSQIGTSETIDYYPIIKVRETQTQVLMKDGETISIGGLLKDVKSESVIKVPLLGDIPLLGWLFQRRTYDTEKVDLVIFITATIIDPSKAAPQAFLSTEEDVSEF